MKNLLALLLLIAVGSPAHASYVSTYQEMRSLSTEVADTYIRGIGEGIMSGNALAAQRGAGFYCQPKNLVLDPSNYHQILMDQVQDMNSRNTPLEDVPVSLILLLGLIRTFPCSTPN